MSQFEGVYAPNCVMLAGGAKNINTAKLFIRWLLGETDGTGEGYKPFLQEGTWSMREGVRADGEIPLEELNLLYIDEAYDYAARDDLMAFLESLISGE